jgi:hypothetical protein
MAFESAQFGVEVRLPQGGVLEAFIGGIPINSIEIGVCEKSFNYNEPRENERIVHDELGISNRLIAPFFVEFYEDQIPWYLANIQRDKSKFVEPWGFARAVRNAMSHGSGILHINDPAAPTVKWHHLHYGPADNGKKIIGTDLGVGDILILMMEMSDNLDQLGCPLP